MNDASRSLADRLLRHLRATRRQPGDHLTEASLQAEFATSRHLARKALAQLHAQGVVRHEVGRGYFLTDLTPCDIGIVPDGDSQLYQRIATDRLDATLPEKVTEDALMRRYAVSRLALRRVLTRIATEGWIERNAGRGWRFTAIIDSAEAYRESYAFRQVVEVAGLRAEGFRFDRAVLDALRQRQEFVRDAGAEGLSSIDLFEANADFHETLASLSGNRFTLPSVRKMNQLRRLVEYRQAAQTDQVLGRNAEHLAILDALDAGDTEAAAQLMHDHLGRAMLRKARVELF